jgi:hypothetical protein
MASIGAGGGVAEVKGRSDICWPVYASAQNPFMEGVTIAVSSRLTATARRAVVDAGEKVHAEDLSSLLEGLAD